MRNLLLAVFLFSSVLTELYAQQNYTVFSEKGKWGVKNGKTILVNPTYESVEILKHDSLFFFKCYQNGLCGLLNEEGKLIYSIEYTDIHWRNDYYAKPNENPDIPYKLNETEKYITLEKDKDPSCRYNYADTYALDSISPSSQLGFGDFKGVILLPVDNLSITELTMYQKKFYLVNSCGDSFSRLLNADLTNKLVFKNGWNFTNAIMKCVETNDYRKQMWIFNSGGKPNEYSIIDYVSGYTAWPAHDGSDSLDASGHIIKMYSGTSSTNFHGGRYYWLDSSLICPDTTFGYTSLSSPFYFNLNSSKYLQFKEYVDLEMYSNKRYFDGTNSDVYTGEGLIVSKFVNSKIEKAKYDIHFGLVDYFKKEIIPLKYLSIDPFVYQSKFYYKCLNEHDVFEVLDAAGKKLYEIDGKGFEYFKEQSWLPMDSSQTLGMVREFKNQNGLQFFILNKSGKLVTYKMSYLVLDENRNLIGIPCNNYRFQGGNYKLIHPVEPRSNINDVDSLKISMINEFNNNIEYWSPTDSVNFCISNEVDTNSLILAKNKLGWGAYSTELELKIPHIYKHIQVIYASEEYYLCKNSNQSDLYDSNGKLLSLKNIENLYSYQRDSVFGYAYKSNNSYYFTKSLDTLLNIVQLHDSVSDFKPIIYLSWQEEYGVYGNYSGYSYDDGSGRVTLGNALGEVYQNNELFSNCKYFGDAIIVQNSLGKTGLIDVKGKLIIPFEYNEMNLTGVYNGWGDKGPFTSTEFIIAGINLTGNITYGLIDSHGKFILDCEFTKIEEFTDSLLKLFKPDESWFIFNPFTNVKLGPLKNDNNNVFNYGYQTGILNNENGKLFQTFVVQNAITEKYGVVNNRLVEIIPSVYDEILTIDRIFYQVKLENKYALFNSKGTLLVKLGEYVIEPLFGNGYSNKIPGFIVVKNEKSTKVFNRNNKVIVNLANGVIKYNEDDFLIRCNINDSIYLIDTNGLILFKKNLDLILAFDKNLAICKKDSLFGLVNRTGKFMIPVTIENFVVEDNGHPHLAGGSMIFERNNLFGLIDTNNNVIIEPIYTLIVKVKDNLLVVVKDKLQGAVDANGKVISPIIHNVIYSYDMNNYQTANYKINRNDTSYLFGLLDSNFIQVLPNRYKEMGNYEKSCECYPLVDTSGNIFYFHLPSKEIMNNSQAFEKSEYGKQFLNNLKLNFNPNWETTNGPIAADATAFYLDNNGNYWLGTGSSGGVFFSSDKGNTWIERNNGIGACHVINIGVLRDTIFIATPSGAYFYKEKENIWLKNLRESEIANELYNYAKQKAISRDLEFKTIFDSSSSHIYSQNQWHIDNMYYYDYMGISTSDFRASFYEGNYDKPKHHLIGLTKSSFVSVEFPKDVFSQPGGNIFKDKDSTLLILSKSGIFKQSNQHLSRLNNTGLIASDIRQIVQTKGGYYALTGNADIWLFQTKEKKWQNVFDGYIVSLKTIEGPAGFYINELVYDTPSSILFGSGGTIFKLDGKKLSNVLKSDSAYLYNNKENKVKLFPINAVSNGKMFYGTALFYSTYDGLQTCIFKFDKGKYKVIKVSRKSWGFVAKDFNKNIWVEDGDTLGMLRNDTVLINKIECNNSRKLNSFSFSKSGKIAVIIDNSSLQLFDNGHWNEIKLVDDKLSLLSIGFDEKDNIFIGTGVTYSYDYCGYGYYGEAKGLYKLDCVGNKGSLTRISGEPNKWILSLTTAADGLMVGTSGSGMYYIKTKK